MAKAKNNTVGISQKPMGLEQWRALPEDLKLKYTNDIVNRIFGGQKQELVSEELHIGRHIITRLAENNGIAYRGQYRRRNPIVIPNPLVTDIDVIPDDAVTLAGQRREEANKEAEKVKKEQDEMLESSKATNETNNKNNTSTKDTSLIKEMTDAIPLIKKMCEEDLCSELVEVLIVTKGVTLHFKP